MPDIKVKNYHGEDVILENATKVYHHTPESTIENPIKVPFTYGEAVSKSVELDFSNGDVEVPIAEGELVTELTIPVPEGLVPGNIAKDVEIAGIIGTLAGGGNIKINGGTISSAGAVTIEHGLGVVPDIIIVSAGAFKGSLSYAIGFSSALLSKVNGIFSEAGNSFSFYAYCTSANGKDFYWDGSTVGMEYSTKEPTIRNVTAESFDVGSAAYPAAYVVSGMVFAKGKWVAISILNG